MKKNISVFFLPLVLLVSACTGMTPQAPTAPGQSAPAATEAPTTGWSAKDKQDFITQCTEAAKANVGDKAASYCDCMLKKIEVKYPTAVAAQALSIADMNAMAKECVQ